ncbi:MAG: molybdopterin converting factor subunit 1 [Thermogemmatispora sp.]|uniref:molybdopterin converting factor subunit 1 n=1 Tax=Thermogemmatispora sp. TaxID=1968838 RepID=UPI0019DA224D|nr:molybdopterin converting factor subunit 1 [Thermogemmatispora sp.]MBE3565544.1 molybdopterin converting factor subunit 1 [Thermogemmatispora sp.]
MKIRVRYFAGLREIVGQDAETLTVPEGTDVAGARALLSARHSRLQPILERSLCAVNREYVPADRVLQEDDELVFIPPLGGGVA